MEILDTASSPENAVHFTDAEIAPVVVALTTKLFRRSTETLEIRLPKFQVMVTALSEVFGIPEVKLTTGPVREMGYVSFDLGSNTLETEQYLSLVTVLDGFARALLAHKPELRGSYAESPCNCGRGSCAEAAAAAQAADVPGLDPIAFGLSMFKQAAPVMFEEAKNRGRLGCVNVPYTDDGRLTAERHARAEAEFTGEDAAPEGHTRAQLPPAAGEAPRLRPGAQTPDVDPENLQDRGQGRGED